MLLVEFFRGCSGHRLDCRERAQSVGLNAEDRIKFASEVCVGDYCGKLYQLLVGEILLEFGEEAFGHALSRMGHALGRLQGQLLASAEEIVAFIGIKVC